MRFLSSFNFLLYSLRAIVQQGLKNLEVSLYIRDESDKKVYHPGIGFFNLSKGIISYRTVSPSEKYYYKTESDIEEPFEDAARRVGVWDDSMKIGLEPKSEPQ